MKHRLFVAINLPDDILEKIRLAVAELDQIFGQRALANFRFLDPENWHLTITFLGYQEDEALTGIIGAIKETAANLSSPEIRLEKIIYGPVGAQPRMIWLIADRETSKWLSDLKNQLDEKLVDNRIRFQLENRPYAGHLTLARFEAAALKNLPPIERELNLHFTAEGLDLMESVLKRSGAEYTRLAAFEFSGKSL